MANSKWYKSKNLVYYFLLTAIIFLGFYLRFKGFLANPSFWHDESALAWNVINKNYLELFGKLRFLQAAPVGFLIVSKFLVNLFNVSGKIGICELVLRLIPFVCGTLSIGIFYLICKNVFSSKKAVLAAVFAFSINKILIDYNFEFKQYGVEVFVALLLILFFQKLCLEKTNYKKLFLYSFFPAVSIWFSFTSVFVLTAGFFNLLIKKNNIKRLIFLFLPSLISIFAYLNFFILNAYQNNGQGLMGFWGENFVNLNLSNFLGLFLQNLSYFFYPAKALLFILILMLYGIFIFYKNKEYSFVNIGLFSLLFLVLASMLHLYPFSQRLIIFLIPIFIIFITKSFDEINKTKKIKSFFIIFMMLSFVFPQLNFAIQTLKTNNFNKGDFSKEIMQYMVKNLKPQDKIFVNNGSIADFEYYKRFFSFKNNTTYKLGGEKADKEYLKLLSDLPKGDYWLYLPYDYSYGKDINFLKTWAKDNSEILFSKNATQSTLLYIKIK